MSSIKALKHVTTDSKKVIINSKDAAVTRYLIKPLRSFNIRKEDLQFNQRTVKKTGILQYYTKE